MRNLAISIMSIITSVIVFFKEPWKNIESFVLIKKESGFKFDGNKMIEQASEIFNKTNIADASGSPAGHVNNLENVNPPLNTPSVQSTFNTIYQNETWQFILGFGFLSFSFFVLSYKYIILKGKYKKSLQVVKDLISTNKNTLLVLESSKKLMVQNREHLNKWNAFLKKTADDLTLVKSSSQNAKTIIKKFQENQRNFVKSQLRIIQAAHIDSITKFESTLKNSSLKKIKKIKKEIIDSRTFESLKFKDSYIIYSALSLLVFYSLIDLGLTDTCKDAFLSAVNSSTLPSYSDHCGLTLKDFDDPSKSLNFQISSTSYDNVLQVHRKNIVPKLLNF